MDELLGILRDKILAYVEQHGVRLEQLAREMNVPMVQLHAIAKGKATTCPLHVCFAILAKVSPDEAVPLMHKYHRFGFDLFTAKYVASGRGNPDFKKHHDALEPDTNVLNLIFKSVPHYRLYGWILTRMKYTDILETFGLEGSRILEEFLENGVVRIEEDGSVSEILNHIIVMKPEHFMQQALFNIESFSMESSPFVINNEIANMNPEGLQRFWQVIQEANLKINEIVHDPANFGQQPVIYSLAFSRLPKALHSHGFDRSLTHAAGLAHDMRAPLRHISNYLENQSPSGDDASIRRAKAAMLRVEHMIDSLRKLEGEEIVSRQMAILRTEPLQSLAQCLADDFRIKFSFSGESLIRGSLDIEKVDRAIQNLLSNAFEAARTSVHMEWYEDGDSWVIRVEDDGVGIPDNIVTKIFDRGFTSGKPQGTGLGLAQVKSLADGHDGTIHCERVNEKTVFTLTLRNVFAPVLADEETAEPTRVLEEKPILFLESSDAQLQEHLFEVITALIPEYRITSDKNLLPEAKVACTDSLNTAVLASEISPGRVWNPTLDSMRNLRFAEALKQLAFNEMANLA